MASDGTMSKLRAWWAHRQGLDGRLAGASPGEVLTRTGWARSVGGSAPYLGFFARAGLDRETVDISVARLQIHQLPAARGCTYVVPAEDFAMALAVGSRAPLADIDMAIRHLGVSPAEIDRLSDTVLTILQNTAGPLDPAAIRKAAGECAELGG